MGGKVELVSAGSSGKSSQKSRGRESRWHLAKGRPGRGTPVQRPWGWDVVRTGAQRGRVFVAERLRRSGLNEHVGEVVGI